MRTAKDDMVGHADEGRVIVGVNAEGVISLSFEIGEEMLPDICYMDASEALALAKRLLQAAAGSRLKITAAQSRTP